jgi:hypothetical protein
MTRNQPNRLIPSDKFQCSSKHINEGFVKVFRKDLGVKKLYDGNGCLFLLMLNNEIVMGFAK